MFSIYASKGHKSSSFSQEFHRVIQVIYLKKEIWDFFYDLWLQFDKILKISSLGKLKISIFTITKYLNGPYLIFSTMY